MSDLHATFGPRGEEEERVFAVEALLADVQLAIQSVMHEKGVTKSDLAMRLGCKPSNVTQLLSENANLKVQTVARIFHALGAKCEFRRCGHDETKERGDVWRFSGSVAARRHDDVVVRYSPTGTVRAHNSNRRRAIAA